MARTFDRYELYESAVQDPAQLVPILRALHGGEPRVLGEDFCGTAAVSRTWLATDPAARAIAVDLDSEALRRARGRERLTVLEGDVRKVVHAAPVDMIFVGNFSIGELHERAELVKYLRRSHERLARGGMFVCDTYGGESAFRVGSVERRHALAGGEIVHHVWEQRSADPRTGEVVAALHFRVERAGEIVQEVPDAFVYRWRLWSLPELRDALLEAGFAPCTVHAEIEPIGLAERSDPRTSSELAASFIVLVAARAHDGT